MPNGSSIKLLTGELAVHFSPPLVVSISRCARPESKKELIKANSLLLLAVPLRAVSALVMRTEQATRTPSWRRWSRRGELLAFGYRLGRAGTETQCKLGATVVRSGVNGRNC